MSLRNILIFFSVAVVYVSWIFHIFTTFSDLFHFALTDSPQSDLYDFTSSALSCLAFPKNFTLLLWLPDSDLGNTWGNSSIQNSPTYTNPNSIRKRFEEINLNSNTRCHWRADSRVSTSVWTVYLYYKLWTSNCSLQKFNGKWRNRIFPEIIEVSTSIVNSGNNSKHCK